MTPEQQRIAIAEACGYVKRPDSDWYLNGLNCGSQGIPDYLNDLNAMRDAEQSLWWKHWDLRCVFIDHLARILNPVYGYRMQDGIDLLDATAAQRAEAFLKTLNLWKP